MSTGEKHRSKPDHVMIEPILRGVAQLIGVLLVPDAGVGDGGPPEPGVRA